MKPCLSYLPNILHAFHFTAIRSKSENEPEFFVNAETQKKTVKIEMEEKMKYCIFLVERTINYIIFTWLHHGYTFYHLIFYQANQAIKNNSRGKPVV